MPYVVLTRKKRIRKAGELVTYYAGDTVDVGNQLAAKWLLEGSAKDSFNQLDSPRKNLSDLSCGILITRSDVTSELVKQVFGDIDYTIGELSIPYDVTALWDGITAPDKKFVNYGWLRMTQSEWELAARLTSLGSTVEDYGTDKDKRATKQLVGDLRFPAYYPGLFFIRKTRDSARFLEIYSKGLEAGISAVHSFARSLFQTKVMLCTLPLE